MEKADFGRFQTESEAEAFLSGIEYVNDSAIKIVGVRHEEHPSGNNWRAVFIDEDTEDAIETEDDGSRYDYDLQVWVKNGIIEDCGHPLEMTTIDRDGHTHYCCNAKKYALEKINDVTRN